MGRPTGFMEHGREDARRRPVEVRLRDWREVYETRSADVMRTQAGRCMDCGIPFCHDACPLGNLVPEWSDLVSRDDWAAADERLHATNNFPEFTGRLCPAPCEGACVLGIDDEPVTIERVELEIAERGFAEGWVVPITASRSGRTIAVVGSGPAGLACAQQLARAGHDVMVFERAEAPGGLLRYGIPEFKLEKSVIDRRLEQLVAEGVTIRCRTSVETSSRTAAPDGADVVSARSLQAQFDAVVLATGSTVPRDLPIDGRELSGIAFAMDYLRPSNLVREGRLAAVPHDAAGKVVVIVGGGDTGADCLGTAHRQGARSVTQLEILESPPSARAADNPWPTWPVVVRTSSAHEEGGLRRYGLRTARFVGERGRVMGLEVLPGIEAREVPSTPRAIAAELVVLAMGFVGPEAAVLDALGVDRTARGTIAVDPAWSTSAPKVFACGDAVRGQSLIVWAIAEGRSCAVAVDRALMGTSELPAPVVPYQSALA
ncbi:MAG TPA: glutamate synthase subunit beta [Acidimicrobiales bacterium]|nr:glutamate synthase subunit beta [Acidimicrobiales bacterium]